jgi:hypothetical protein
MEGMTINAQQRLYVIGAGEGFTCLGFEVAERKRKAVLTWMGEKPPKVEVGTLAAYEAYHDAMRRGASYAEQTGQRCLAELDPRIDQYRGKRVEVTEPDGTKRRFIVGVSTGWMPCNLEVFRRTSKGGPAALVGPNDTIKLVEVKR